MLLSPAGHLRVPVASRHRASTSRVHDDHWLGALVRVLLVVQGDLSCACKPHGTTVSTVRDVAELFVAARALPVAPVLVVGPLEALVGALPVRVAPAAFDDVGILPQNPFLWVCRGVHGIQLVVERPETIPLQLQVEEAVHVFQEVLEPVWG